MDEERGLRERKKHKTRQLIADTARELFARRGLKNVSVAEIARAAEVSETTVSVSRTIASSPALAAREQQILAR